MSPLPGHHGDTTLRLAPDHQGVRTAADLLRAGRLVAFPTETVYGLGADAGNAAGVAALYAAKGRPAFNPLIAHVADRAAAERLARFDTAARRLADAFWPGPLTLVLPLIDADAVCELARAGLDTVGIRVPAHPLANALLGAVARPVVAPSANRSGRISPTEAGHVLDDLDGRIAAVLDAGPSPIGVESSIVACLPMGQRLLRPGGIAREALESVLGEGFARDDRESTPQQTQARLSPGLLASHYAPRSAVRLAATTIAPGEAALLFGPFRPAGLEGAGAQINLSPAGDLAEAASSLFGSLRALDARLNGRHAMIAVAPIPETGLGEAINDRLRRAAAPR